MTFTHVPLPWTAADVDVAAMCGGNTEVDRKAELDSTAGCRLVDALERPAEATLNDLNRSWGIGSNACRMQ